MDRGWWHSRTDLNIGILLEICIVLQWSVLHIFGEITSLSSEFCRLRGFLQSALCDIIISGYSEGIVSFNPRINWKIWRDTGEDLRGYGIFRLRKLKQWERIYCACSAICDRALLYLKVSRLCLLVLPVRVVCSWRQEWIVGGMVVTGKNWSTRKKSHFLCFWRWYYRRTPISGIWNFSTSDLRILQNMLYMQFFIVNLCIMCSQSLIILNI
jgi:hypothetical protein